MKLVIFCVLSLVIFAMAAIPALPYGRECIYIDGKCVEYCPEGTHSYTTGCSPRTPEPTCEEPNPVEEDYDICDYSDCYCDAPTVRDTVSKKCVELEDCPKKEKPKGHTGNSV